VDASLNTEPIKTREGKAAKAVRPKGMNKRESGQQNYQAKLDAEFIKAQHRLYPIFFRKEGGSVKIILSQASLDVLKSSPGSLSPKQIQQEKWDLLCLHFDQYGLVNHRVVKDEPVRLEMTSVILRKAIDHGGVETITRVSWFEVSLSVAVMQAEKIALAEHQRRLVVRRQGKKAAA
jgi:hypothetical protein